MCLTKGFQDPGSRNGVRQKPLSSRVMGKLLEDSGKPVTQGAQGARSGAMGELSPRGGGKAGAAPFLTDTLLSAGRMGMKHRAPELARSHVARGEDPSPCVTGAEDGPEAEHRGESDPRLLPTFPRAHPFLLPVCPQDHRRPRVQPCFCRGTCQLSLWPLGLSLSRHSSFQPRLHHLPITLRQSIVAGSSFPFFFLPSTPPSSHPLAALQPTHSPTRPLVHRFTRRSLYSAGDRAHAQSVLIPRLLPVYSNVSPSQLPHSLVRRGLLIPLASHLAGENPAAWK